MSPQDQQRLLVTSEASAAREPCTFGSARYESSFGNMIPAITPASRPGMIRALRFQDPGPGAYSPGACAMAAAHGAAVSQTSAFPLGASWGREDRLKHLAATVRPKDQYNALPLRCGPSPGFYSNPTFPAPKEHAVAGSRCRVQYLPPASALPGGQPPERNRPSVEAVRALNRQSSEGPAPTAYNAKLEAYSQYPIKMAGRWTARKGGDGASPAKLRAAATDGRIGVASAVGGGREAQGGGRGEGVEQIEEQAEEIERKARDRRLDLRRRDVVEDELDRVRQKHRLLAAGATRRIAGLERNRRRGTAGGCGGGAEGGEQLDIIVRLRERLDGSLQRMSDLFKAIDSSWDGLVDAAELGLALRSLGLDVTREELRELFASIDTDRSGEIDFRELKRAMTRPRSPPKKESADSAAKRWEAAQKAALQGKEQLFAGERRRAVALRHGSPWALGTGRDVSTDLLSGVEPADRRSLGPATYDPRPGTLYVKHSTSVGGDLTKGQRQQLLPQTRSVARFVYRGLAELPPSEPLGSTVGEAVATSPGRRGRVPPVVANASGSGAPSAPPPEGPLSTGAAP